MLKLEIPNAENGVTVCVTEITEGYSVTVRDDDAGMVYPSAMIYPDYERAVEYAHKVAEGKGSGYLYIR